MAFYSKIVVPSSSQYSFAKKEYLLPNSWSNKFTYWALNTFAFSSPYEFYVRFVKSYASHITYKVRYDVYRTLEGYALGIAKHEALQAQKLTRKEVARCNKINILRAEEAARKSCNYNKFSPLEVDNLPEVSTPYGVDPPLLFDRRVDTIRYRTDNDLNINNKQIKLIKIKKERNLVLLLKLKLFIIKLNNARSYKFNKSIIKNLYKISNILNNSGELTDFPISQCEMDSGATSMESSSNIKEDTSSNTCIQSQSKPDVEVIKPSSIPKTLSTNDVLHNYEDLLSRWVMVQKYKWTKEGLGNIDSPEVPYYIIQRNLKNPSMIPFTIYSYFQGDIELKFVLNSSPFMSGQIISSFVYGNWSDRHFDTLRDNIYTATQRPHVLISAGSGNEAILHIPYKNPQPYLPITASGGKQRDDVGNILSLGTVLLNVMNNLQSTSTIQSEATISMFARFKNVDFVGMRSSDVGVMPPPANIAVGEMMSAITAGATEGLLNYVGKQINVDKPPYTEARMPIAPQACQNISAAKGHAYVTNSMRFDPTVLTPISHKVVDEMKVKSITSKFGLVKQIDWSTAETSKNSYGSLLATFDASPMWEFSDYETINVGSELKKCYWMPPVAIVSSMYAYWRGCLDMRVDIIGNKFHRGKLLVSYIPKVIPNDNIDIEKAKGSYYMVYDLAEIQTFTYTIPFISNRYAVPRRVGFDDESNGDEAPGKVYIFVLNPLVCMDNIPNNVKLNVYWAGSEDFEVLVPAQPTVALPYWLLDVTSKISPDPGYTPIYIGSWEKLNGNKKGVLRYNWKLNDIVMFTGLKYDTSYTCDEELEFVKPDGTKSKHKVFVPAEVDDGYGMIYLAPIYITDLAKYCKVYLKDGKTRNPDFHNRDLLIDVKPSDDSAAYSSDKPTFTSEFVNWPKTGDFECVSLSQCEMLRSVSFDFRKERENQCQLLKCVPRRVDRLIFGEDFSDLKDLTKRQQPYAVFNVSVDESIGNAGVIVPLYPQGLRLTPEEDTTKGIYITTAIRDGHIPIILSGYNFWRGGMDITVFVKTKKDNGKINVWIQHRPDFYPKKQTVYSVISNSKDPEMYFNHSYATMYMSTTVNNIGHFTIPYYQPYAFSFCCNPDFSMPYARQQTSNGALVMGFEGTKSEVQVQIMYSLSDEAVFEYFKGFPPMQPLGKYTPPKKISQYEGIFDSVQSACKDGVTLNMPDIQNLNDTLEKGINLNINSPAIDKIVTTVENVNIDTALETVNKSISTQIKDIFGSLIDLSTDVLYTIGNIIMHPTVKSMAWGVAFVLLKVGVLTKAVFKQFVDSILKFFNYIKLKFSSSETPEQDPQQPSTSGLQTRIAKPEMDSDEVLSIVDVGFTAVSQIVNMAVSKPKNLKGYINCLNEGLTKSIRSGNFFYLFLKNNMNLFKKIYVYYTTLFYKDAFLEELISNDMVAIQDWCDEVDILLDPANDEKAFALDSKWSHRVEVAYVMGSKLNKHFIQYEKSQHRNNHSSQTYQVFNQLYKRICKKREDMYKRGKAGVSRREPFCIWMSGEAGIGKSQVSHDIATKLIKNEGISFEGEITYTLQTNAAYWNGCRQQPCIFLDDFMNIREGNMRDLAIANFWMLKSPMVLNPPQAALEDKEARYSPEIMIVSSNLAYPGVVNIDTKALYRRRDILIQAELCKIFKDQGIYVLTQMNREQFMNICVANNISTDNYEHLRFYIYDDPSDPTSPKSLPMTYPVLIDKLCANFSTYRAAQMRLYENHLRAYEEVLLDDSSCVQSLSEKKEELDNMCKFLMEYEMQDSTDFKTYLKIGKMVSQGQVVSDEMMKTIRKITRETRRGKYEENSCLICELRSDPKFKIYFTNAEPIIGKHKCVSPSEKVTFKDLFVWSCEMPKDCKHMQITLGHDYIVTSNSYSDLINPDISAVPCKESNCPMKFPVLKYVVAKLVMNIYPKDQFKTLPHLVTKEMIEIDPSINTDNPLPSVISVSSTSFSKRFRNNIKTFYEKTKVSFESFYDKYIIPSGQVMWKVIKYAFPLITLAFLGLSLYGVFTTNGGLFWKGFVGSWATKSATPIIDKLVEPSNEVKYEIVSSGDTTTVKNLRSANKPMYTTFAKFESGEQHQIETCNSINRNTFMVSSYNDGIAGKPNRVVLVGENCFIMPKHYITSWKLQNVEQLRFHNSGCHKQTHIVNFDSLQIQECLNQDMVFVRVSSMPCGKTLAKRFANEQEHKRPRWKAYFLEITDGFHLLKEIEINSNATTYIEEPNGTITKYDYMYSYNYHGVGKCGNLILDFNLNNPIIGMHVAGDGTNGFAVPLVKEAFPFFSRVVVQPGVLETNVSQPFEGRFKPIGVTDTGLSHTQSSETRIKKSLVHGLFPVISAPAPLKVGDPRVEWTGEKPYSPLFNGVECMMQPVLDFPVEDVELAKQNLIRQLLVKCKPVSKLSVLTYSDAICGVPNLKYYDGIDMNTSEGFPFSRYRPANVTNKSWLFQLEGRNDGTFKCIGIDKTLLSVMEEKQRIRLEDNNVMTVFDDCLKDARLPLEKIKKPRKTRVFSASPIDYTIQCKQYMSDFQAAFKHSRICMSHAIGINPDGVEWTTLANYLLEVGDFIVTGDYSNFGPSLNSTLIGQVIDCIVKWYEHYWYETNNCELPECVRRMITHLLKESNNSFHCTREFIWQAFSGIPSGSPWTVELNTLVNYIMLQCAWLAIFRGTFYDTIEAFNKYVRVCIYGDDVIISVAEECIETFNNNSLSIYFGNFGIKFTDASKAGNIPYVRGLENATFLKRSFSKHPYWEGYYLAPLDEDYSVKEVANWCHNSNDMKTATEESIMGANNNAYSLGPDRFSKVSKVLQAALISINSDVRLRTWNELDKLHFSNFYI